MSLYLISYQKSVELEIFPYQTIFGIWTQCVPVKHSKTEQFYKWDRHAFWPPKNPPLYSRKYECNYHFVEALATFFCEDSVLSWLELAAAVWKKRTSAFGQIEPDFSVSNYRHIFMRFVFSVKITKTQLVLFHWPMILKYMK